MSNNEIEKFGIWIARVVGHNDGGVTAFVETLATDKETSDSMVDHIEKVHMGSKLVEVEKSGGSVFGFTSWKGSTWVPEGPKPNWVTFDKKLN